MAQADDTHRNAICPSCGALPCDQSNMPADGWQVGEIELRVEGDQAAPVVERTVAGWVKGLFGLDARVFYDDNENLTPGFVLTHLPTGYVVRQLHCGLSQAKQIADQIAEGADWHFHDAADGPRVKACGPAVLAVMQSHPNTVFGGAYARALGPLAA